MRPPTPGPFCGKLLFFVPLYTCVCSTVVTHKHHNFCAIVFLSEEIVNLVHTQWHGRKLPQGIGARPLSWRSCIETIFPDLSPAHHREATPHFQLTFCFNSQKEEVTLEEENEPLDVRWPVGWRKRITYILLAPLIFPLWITIPDVRRPVSTPDSYFFFQNLWSCWESCRSMQEWRNPCWLCVAPLRMEMKPSTLGKPLTKNTDEVKVSLAETGVYFETTNAKEICSWWLFKMQKHTLSFWSQHIRPIEGEDLYRGDGKWDRPCKIRLMCICRACPISHFPKGPVKLVCTKDTFWEKQDAFFCPLHSLFSQQIKTKMAFAQNSE